MDTSNQEVIRFGKIPLKQSLKKARVLSGKSVDFIKLHPLLVAATKDAVATIRDNLDKRFSQLPGEKIKSRQFQKLPADLTTSA